MLLSLLPATKDPMPFHYAKLPATLAFLIKRRTTTLATEQEFLPQLPKRVFPNFLRR
jgi:hypothetical protein